MDETFLLNNQTEQHETTKKEGEFRKIMSRTDKRRKSMNKFLKSSKNILNSKYPLRPRLHTEISDGKIINKEYLQNSRNSNNIIGFNLIEKSQQNEDTKNTMSNNDTKANQDSNNKKLKRKKKYLEKYYYYPKIFQDNEDLDNNCIYCVSGKAFHFLYSNREKKQCKYLLEKIHKYCKIFFCMSSLDKSLVIDFYREFKGSSICNIGECQNDYDAIMTSNVGICLKPPKNINTLMAHFFLLILIFYL